MAPRPRVVQRHAIRVLVGPDRLPVMLLTPEHRVPITGLAPLLHARRTTARWRTWRYSKTGPARPTNALASNSGPHPRLGGTPNRHPPDSTTAPPPDRVRMRGAPRPKAYPRAHRSPPRPCRRRRAGRRVG